MQLTLLRAWRRRDAFEAERGTPRAWLMAILLDQARRQRTRARSPSGSVSPLIAHRSPDLGVDARLDIDRAISTLPRRQRQAVVLFYLADLSVREVSAVLGISEGSVKAYLFEARAALRTVLEDS